MYLFRNSFTDESTASDEYKQSLNGMRQASSRNENKCLCSEQEKISNLKENKDGTVLSRFDKSKKDQVSHLVSPSGSDGQEEDDQPEFIKQLNLDDSLADYHLGHVIGRGGFGQVISGSRKIDNLPVAIKFVHKTSVKEFKRFNGQRIPSEAYFLHKAQHRHVIKIYECFTVGNYYVFVMERPTICEDLSHILLKKIFTENQARRYFTQILEAAICSEENGVIHRDLKPANILVDMETDEIKIIDFGLASEVQCVPYYFFRGTPAYMPPEFLSSGWYDGCQSTVWALGMILAEMVSSYMAFNGPELALTREPRIPEYLSEEAKDLIRSMLNIVPINRPSLRQILKHPWFAVQDSDSFDDTWPSDSSIQSSTNDAISEAESFAFSEAKIIDNECCSSVLKAEQSWNVPWCEEDYSYSLKTEDYENLLSLEAEIDGNEACKYFLKTEDSGNGPSFACETSPSEDCMHFLIERDPGHLPMEGHVKKADDKLDNGYCKRRGSKIERHPDRKFHVGNNTSNYNCQTPAHRRFEVRRITFAIKPALVHGHSTANERTLATEMTHWRKGPPGCDENSSDRISRLNQSLFCH